MWSSSGRRVIFPGVPGGGGNTTHSRNDHGARRVATKAEPRSVATSHRWRRYNKNYIPVRSAVPRMLTASLRRKQVSAHEY